MIIKNDNGLAFAFESRLADFSFEKKGRLVAMLDIREGLSVPVTLRAHDQQLHLETHLPFAIKGEAAWAAYEDFAARGGDFFSLWIDPIDGETKYVLFLSGADVEELDAALAKTAACLDSCWEDLERYGAVDEDNLALSLAAFNLTASLAAAEKRERALACDEPSEPAEPFWADDSSEAEEPSEVEEHSWVDAPSGADERKELVDVDGMSFGDFLAAALRRGGV